MECPAGMIMESVPLDPIGHLLHKVPLLSLGDIAILPNTQKQTQGGCKNEMKKHGPNEKK